MRYKNTNKKTQFKAFQRPKTPKLKSFLRKEKLQLRSKSGVTDEDFSETLEFETED